MRGSAMKGLGLFIFSAILVSAHALTVEVPARQIKVARGRNATLRCNFKTSAAVDGSDLLVWRKISSRVDIVSRYFDGLTQYGQGYEQRLVFSGNVNSGDISITITAVTMEDNGTYACSVRLRNDYPAQTELLDLFVLVAPSKPECNIVGTPQYGQNINLTCVSREGSPTPKYSWQSFNVQNEPRVLPYAQASGRLSVCTYPSRFKGSKLKMMRPTGYSTLASRLLHKIWKGQSITEAGTLFISLPLSGASESRRALSTARLVTAAASAVTPSLPGTGVSAGPFPPHSCFLGSTHGQAMCRLSPGASAWLGALLSLQATAFCAKQVPLLQSVQNLLRIHSRADST